MDGTSGMDGTSDVGWKVLDLLLADGPWRTCHLLAKLALVCRELHEATQPLLDKHWGLCKCANDFGFGPCPERCALCATQVRGAMRGLQYTHLGS